MSARASDRVALRAVAAKAPGVFAAQAVARAKRRVAPSDGAPRAVGSIAAPRRHPQDGRSVSPAEAAGRASPPVTPSTKSCAGKAIRAASRLAMFSPKFRRFKTARVLEKSFAPQRT